MTDHGLPTLHVMFNNSGAGSVRTALAAAGRADLVVALPDDLSFGPIDPPDPAARADWVETVLGYDRTNDRIAPIERIRAFWTDSLDPGFHPVAWLSRRSAAEACGFLEWLHRLGDRPCDVIDVTDCIVPERRLHDGSMAPPRIALGTGAIPPTAIVAAGLVARAVALPVAARATYRRHWARLRAENAALRRVVGLELVSAPITGFDDDLLSLAGPDWLPAGRIIGRLLQRHEDSNLSPVNDLVLWSRIRALVAAGRLDHRGDLSGMRSTEIRRADRP